VSKLSSKTTTRSLLKSRRLLRHSEFERVYKQGRRHFASHMTVFYLRRTDGHGSRFGFTVARALGSAVERNRMKRRLREAVRLSGLERALAADIVINPRRSLLETDFAEVRNEIDKALEVIERSLERRSRIGTDHDS
jgi:ribonuclease P protein component